MNLRFKHVTAKNFMSFKNLDFNIEQFDGTTVLITGYNDDIQGESSKNNGAGKSTLNNTIIFAIYGEVLNPLKKSTSIRNWSEDVSSKDDVEVVLTLESGDKEFAIQRLLKGKKCSGELHVFSRGLNSNEEWNEITLSTMAETQRMIETDIVPCSKEGFLRCVILTADQNYNFFKLNKAAKNSFFESLFELTKYSDMYAKLHRMTLDENASLTASSKSIDKFNANILKLEEDKEKAKKNQEDILAAQKELSAFKKELEDFTSSSKIAEELEKLKNEYANYKETSILEMKKEMSEFDSENCISSIDQKHNIVFDKTADERIVAEKMAKYDSENRLEVSVDGKVIFKNDEKYAELNDKKDKLKNRIQNGKDLIKKLVSDISEETIKISKLKSEYDEYTSKQRYMENTLKTESDITNILCPSCVKKYMKSMDMDKYMELIGKYEKMRADKGVEINNATEHKTKDELLLKKYEEVLSIIENDLEDAIKEISKIDDTRREIQNDRDSVLKSIKSSISTEHERLQLRRDQLRSSLISQHKEKCSEFERNMEKISSSCENKKNELMRNIKNAEYKLKLVSDSKCEVFDASIKSLKDSLEEEKRSFDTSNETLSHYKALEEILKPENIRKSVVPDMLKELNFRICGYLAKMGSNYTCRFDDDFEATFISNSGVEAEYNNFSSGEHMRLSIACCLAFRDFMQVRLNFHPNMLVIDEFIDSSLDPMAVGGIMDMIHFMVGTEKISAFIISHRSEIKQDVFDHEITIRKKNDDSKIIIDGMENKLLQ